MMTHRQEVRHTLGLLLDVLVAEDGSGGEWGAGTAARVLAASRDRFRVQASSTAAAKIDAWLEARLTEAGKALEDYLGLAAEAGSSACNGAEVARFLLHRPDRTWPGFITWGAPERPEAWYDARRSDPNTKPLVEAFIRHILPTDRTNYPARLHTHLERLAPDLSGAFLDAAAQAVHFGVIQTDDAIAEGALQDLPGFEQIVDAAVAELTPSEKDRRRNAELALDFANEVYSEEYAQHIAEDDQGYTADVFLKSYVERVRTVRGWRSLVEHRHAGRLLYYWLRLLADEVKEQVLDLQELHAAFKFGYDSDHEALLWRVLSSAWDQAFLPALRNRVVVGHADPNVAQAALEVLIERGPDTFRNVVEELLARGDVNRLVEICIDLAAFRRLDVNGAEVATEVLPMPFRGISNQALILETKGTPVLVDEAQVALSGILTPSEVVRRLRVEMGAIAPLPVEEDVCWLLEHSGDVSTAVIAVEAAIRLGMDAEVEAALNHKFAHVSSRALTALGTRINAPLPAHLLEKASDRGSPVRKALVALLKQKTHIAHLQALITLAKDTWSKYAQHYGDDGDFPIAQGAVEAIAQLAPLPPDEAREMFAIGLDTDDPSVRAQIFHLLAASGDLDLQERLFDLSIRPGRRTSVRSAAARGLLQGAEAVATVIVDKITTRLLASRYEPVAASLALLLAFRGDPDQVRAVAEELATNAKRRVLILLLVWVMSGRDLQVAQEMAAMLPAGHKALTWALGGEIEEPDDALLEDLGDPATCNSVLAYMRIKEV